MKSLDIAVKPISPYQKAKALLFGAFLKAWRLITVTRLTRSKKYQTKLSTKSILSAVGHRTRFSINSLLMQSDCPCTRARLRRQQSAIFWFRQWLKKE